jgi:hypothetical protein
LQGLLALELKKGAMTLAEARVVQDQATRSESSAPKQLRLIIDMGLASQRPKERAAEMDTLVNDLEERLVLDEFLDSEGQDA